ncbi:MAG: hypothetical protein Q4B14_04750 [Clostridia bacterium]|nr:hypothetical protein [Clostridia bacterium]
MKKNKNNKSNQINNETTNFGNTIADKTYTTPILYPDSRFIKTNTACPSVNNVIRQRNWSEFDRL